MTEVKRCSGGQVQFAQSGNAEPYLIKFMACVSAFQDERYGKGNRLHNIQVKDRTVVGARCTVCGTGRGKVRR